MKLCYSEKFCLFTLFLLFYSEPLEPMIKRYLSNQQSPIKNNHNKKKRKTSTHQQPREPFPTGI